MRTSRWISTRWLQLPSVQCFSSADHQHLPLLFPLQLEVLPLLTPKQLAEMLLLPLPTPPEKHVVIDSVMDFLLEYPKDGKLMQVLHHLVKLVEEVTTLSRLTSASLMLPLVTTCYNPIVGQSPVRRLQTNVSLTLSHIVSHKPQDFTADVMICHWKKHGRMHLTRQYALVKYHWQSL